jgi:hypothetical protein
MAVVRGVAKQSLLALCIVLAGALAPGGALAEEAKPFDFKPLVPPVLPPLPPNSTLQSGSVGGQQTPYTTAPLQSPQQQAPTQSAPGIRFSVPSR